MGSFVRDRTIGAQSIRFLKLPTFHASMIHSMRTMEMLSSIVIIVISSDAERADVCGEINALALGRSSESV